MIREANGAYTHNNVYIIDEDLPKIFGSIDENRLEKDLDIPEMAKGDAEKATLLKKKPSTVPAKIMRAAESLMTVASNSYNLKISDMEKQIKTVRKSYDGFRTTEKNMQRQNR